MIHIEEKKIDPDENGNDLNVSIKINCASIKDALREYSFITAHIRDLLIIGGISDDEKLKSTMFAAFRTGMNDIPHTEEAQLIADCIAQHKKLS